LPIAPIATVLLPKTTIVATVILTTRLVEGGVSIPQVTMSSSAPIMRGIIVIKNIKTTLSNKNKWRLRRGRRQLCNTRNGLKRVHV